MAETLAAGSAAHRLLRRRVGDSLRLSGVLNNLAHALCWRHAAARVFIRARV